VSTASGLELETVVTVAPTPQVDFTWEVQPAGAPIQIYRRPLGDEQTPDAAWELRGEVDPPVRAYTDTGLIPGTAYEYTLYRPTFTNGSTSMGRQAVQTVVSIDAPLRDYRGTVLLVVDNTLPVEFASELALLELDLAGDGWKVQRLEFAPHGLGTHQNLKAAILSARAADPGINALYLFGRLPIARSGLIAPDGHSPTRAHETDHYYADLDGVWTDTTKNVSASGSAENENIPGDGKFDQDTMPSQTELMTGRVDFSAMKSFRKTEREYLRDYIQKSHAWRHGLHSVPTRALWNSDYLDLERISLQSTLGKSNITLASFQPTLKTVPHLWAVDFGDYTGTSETSYGATDNQAVFTINFGSYKQMWARSDNPMRALLAQADWGLTSVWGGRPNMFFHPMAAGRSIGFATRQTQNIDYTNPSYFFLFRPFARSITADLMGDPTLRQHPVTAPTSLTVTPSPGAATLNWQALADPARTGFHIYRSTERLGAYTRLTATPLPANSTSFTDAARPAGEVFYQLRAIALTTVYTGTYLDQSQALFARIRSDDTANHPPVTATPSILSVQSSVPTPVRFPGTDANGDTLTPIVITNPAHGLLRWNQGRAFYVSNKDYTGADSFTWCLFDGIALSAPITTTVTVEASRPDVLLGWSFAAGPAALGQQTPGSTQNHSLVAPASIQKGTGLSFHNIPDYSDGAYYVVYAHAASLDPTDYLGWTVAPASPTTKLSLDRLVFASFAGVYQERTSYRSYDLELRASVDGFATYFSVPLDQPSSGILGHAISGSASGGRFFSATLGIIPALQNTSNPIQFRLYTWKCVASGVGTGFGKSGDNSIQNAVDLVVFGQAVPAPETYATWASALNWQGANSSATADPDGDGLSNLLEYATGHQPLTPDSHGATTLGTSTDGLRLKFSFNRIADTTLTYVVEATNDLATGDWTPIFTSTGAENMVGAVTVEDTDLISAHPRRFLRLAVLGGAGVGSTLVEDAPRGFQKVGLSAGMLSLGLPLLNEAVVTAKVQSVSGNVLTLAGGGALNVGANMTLESAYPFYLEVIAGLLEGERLDIDVTATIAANNNTVVLSSDLTRNTLTAGRLAELAGNSVAIRRHLTLTQLQGLFDLALVGSDTAAVADSVYLFEGGAFVQYYLRANASTWRRGSSLTDRRYLPIPPGEGLQVRLQQARSLKQFGIVRNNTFRKNLIAGLQFASNPYPADTGPNELDAIVDVGQPESIRWIGNNSSATADSLYVFSGGAFVQHYLRADGTTWRRTSGLTNYSAQKILKSTESYLIRRTNPDPGYSISVP
jgi:hypothetical protein